MTPAVEARVRAAVAELADALIAALREPAADPAPDGPIDLLSVDAAARRIGIARSTAYLAVRDGSLRSVRIRGRRLVPASEIARLASLAEKQTAPVVAKGPGRSRKEIADAPGVVPRR